MERGAWKLNDKTSLCPPYAAPSVYGTMTEKENGALTPPGTTTMIFIDDRLRNSFAQSRTSCDRDTAEANATIAKLFRQAVRAPRLWLIASI